MTVEELAQRGKAAISEELQPGSRFRIVIEEGAQASFEVAVVIAGLLAERYRPADIQSVELPAPDQTAEVN